MALTRKVNGVSYEVLRYPMKTMNITQGNNGSFSHRGVNALDDAGKDTGIDQTFAPCELIFIGSDSYQNGNAVFLQSKKKVLFADGTIDYASFMFLHDNYIQDIICWAANGNSWKQWDSLGDEGVAGFATGNHCHLEVKKGKLIWNKYMGCGYYSRNSYGTWFLQDSVSADKAFVIDGVKILNGNGMKWKKADQIPGIDKPAPKSGFTDVPDTAWYCDYVIEAKKLGLMTGTSETKFSPDSIMNRAMAVTVLHRMAGKPKAGETSNFSDVKTGMYYSKALSWAVWAGVITGHPDGTFRPEDPCTREQFCTMLYRFFGSPASDQSLKQFKDHQLVSDFALKAVQFCVEKGIITGAENGTKLNPVNKMTRAEACKMIVEASKVK